MRILVGLPPRSKSRRIARKEGFEVVGTAEASRRGEIIFLAVPDTKMPAIYEKEIAPSLSAGKTLLLAHGFAIFYRTIVPPKRRGRYHGRAERARSDGSPRVRSWSGRSGSFCRQPKPDRSRGKETALAWAKAIGCTRAGVIETTFRDETETDLFGEQAVLCGGVSALIRAGFETLTCAGYAPELAYFECLHELKFIVDLIHEAGIDGMRSLISETAKWGDLSVGPRIIDRAVQKQMQKVLQEIHSGKFARDWLRETRDGRKRYAKLLAESKNHPIEKVGARLRSPHVLECESEARPGVARTSSALLHPIAPRENARGATGSGATSLRHCVHRRRKRAFGKQRRQAATSNHPQAAAPR